jgi:hypothetical protein
VFDPTAVLVNAVPPVVSPATTRPTIVADDGRPICPRVSSDRLDQAVPVRLANPYASTPSSAPVVPAME